MYWVRSEIERRLLLPGRRAGLSAMMVFGLSATMVGVLVSGLIFFAAAFVLPEGMVICLIAMVCFYLIGQGLLYRGHLICRRKVRQAEEALGQPE